MYNVDYYACITHELSAYNYAARNYYLTFVNFFPICLKECIHNFQPNGMFPANVCL